MIDDIPAAQPATVDDTALREKLFEAFNAAYIPSGDARLDEEHRHDRHLYSGACYVCRGDVDKLADAVLSVVAPVLAVKDERIAVLQRSWNKARDANTAWLDGGVVALPEDAVGQIAARVHDVLCDCHGNHTGITLRTMDLDKIRAGIRPLIESWRPATEIAVGDRVEWNPTGDRWEPAVVTAANDKHLVIVLDDNGQSLTVERRHVRRPLTEPVKTLPVPERVVAAARLIRRDIYEAMDVIYGEIGGMDDTAEDVQSTTKAIADGIRIVLDWVEQAATVRPVTEPAEATEAGDRD